MNKRDWIIIFFIFLFTLGIGAFYLKFMPTLQVTGDSIDYDLVAQNLIKGEGYSLKEGVPTCYRAPGYPFFLALIYRIFGRNFDIVRIVQFFLLAGVGIIIYLAAAKTLELSSNLAFLASLILIAWPYFIVYSILILTEILFTFFFIISIWLLLKFQEEKTYKNSVMSGIFLGLAVLVRPVILLLPIWLCIFFFVSKKLTKTSFERKKIVIFLFMVFFIISPWTLRNFFQFNSFIPVSSGFNIEMAIGTFGHTYDSIAPKAGKATLKTTVLAKLKHIYLFWNPGVEGKNAQILLEKYPWVDILFLIYKITFFVILGAAFLSLKFVKQSKIFLIWVVIFYFWALHTILYPYPRYTLPIIPLVILLAFVSFNHLFKFLHPKIQESF